MTTDIRYRALLIGNNFYDDPSLNNLKGPEREVEKLKEALTDPRWGLFAERDVKPLYDHLEANTRREISSFLNGSRHDDALLLFFSGHGENLDNQLYLCARDTDLSNLEGTATPASWLKQVVERAPSQRVVVILDCCNSGIFKARLDFSEINGAGFFFLTSTFGSGKSSDAIANDGLSEFTRSLVDALTGQGDVTEGWVRFSDVARYVTARMRQSTGQTVGSGGHHTGDLALACESGASAPSTSGERWMPAGAAKSSQTRFDWPAWPTPEQAFSMLEEWAESQRSLPRPLQTSMPRIVSVCKLRITIAISKEDRTEETVTVAVDQPLPVDQYFGPISGAVTAVDGVPSDRNFQGMRHGSDSIVACQVCDRGKVRCEPCGGLGRRQDQPRMEFSEAPRREMGGSLSTGPCIDCQGTGKVNCRPCKGRGELRSYTLGTVVRRVLEESHYIGEVGSILENENQQEGRVRYREVGFLDELDLSGIPRQIQRDLSVLVDTEERMSRRGRRWHQIEIAIFPEARVEFNDGSNEYSAHLSGASSTLYVPPQVARDIRARWRKRLFFAWLQRNRIPVLIATGIFGLALLLFCMGLAI